MWMENFPMRILNQYIDFNPRIESSIVLIWTIPHLPLCLIHKDALFEFAQNGKPLIES